MCTLTWLHTGSAYQVFFNRDELNTRQRALPPSVHQLDGTRFIAPTDVDAGGTWIAVNALGTSLCLLNNYAAAQAITRDDWVSRGHLVRSLAALRGPDAVEALRSTSLDRYRAFDLVIFDPTISPTHCAWSNNELTIRSASQPLTSSSYDTERVISGRVARFHDLSLDENPSAEALRAYHNDQFPERSAYSVCMQRPDAQTVSFTQLMVNSESVEMTYIDGAPCSNTEPTRLALSRMSHAKTVAATSAN